MQSRAEMNRINGLKQYHSRVSQVSLRVNAKVNAGGGGCPTWSYWILDTVWYVCCSLLVKKSTFTPTVLVFMAKIVQCAPFRITFRGHFFTAGEPSRPVSTANSEIVRKCAERWRPRNWSVFDMKARNRRSLSVREIYATVKNHTSLGSGNRGGHPNSNPKAGKWTEMYRKNLVLQ